MLTPGDVLADRYVVERQLAQGGMATVYVVRHQQLDSRHAVKVLDLSTPDIRKRLLQEGRIQASLRHPNIVAVTDAVDHDGHPALVMEYVDGPNLGECLEAEKPSLDQAERWFLEILDAVQFAHSRGLVHRDLKPENVLMAPLPTGRLPKVTDFGIAKVVGDYLADREGPGTRSGLAMGTPAYMPPEQADSAAAVDHRADVFALGCILYELVCGKRAFEGENVHSVFAAVLNGDYTPPHDLVPDLPQRFVDAIDGSLRANREQRLQSCAKLREALQGRSSPSVASGRTWVPDAEPVVAAPVVAAAAAVPVRQGSGGTGVVFAVLGVLALISMLSAVGLVFALAVLGAALDDEDVWLQDTGVLPADWIDVDPNEGRGDVVDGPAPDELAGLPISVLVVGWDVAGQVQRGAARYPVAGRDPVSMVLVVEVSMMNQTGSPVSLEQPWVLRASDGTEFHASRECHYVLENSLPPVIRLRPGETAAGLVCIDAPDDLLGAVLSFEPAELSYPPLFFPL